MITAKDAGATTGRMTIDELAAALADAETVLNECQTTMLETDPDGDWVWGTFGSPLSALRGCVDAGLNRVAGNADHEAALMRLAPFVDHLADAVATAKREFWQRRRASEAKAGETTGDKAQIIAQPIEVQLRLVELPGWVPSEEEPEPLVPASWRKAFPDQGERIVCTPDGTHGPAVGFYIDGAFGNRALEVLAAEDKRLNGILVAEIRRQVDRDRESGGSVLNDFDRTRRIADLIAQRTGFTERHYAEQYILQCQLADRRVRGI